MAGFHSWNDEEDDALQGLPALTQIIYLRGIKRFMDYETALVGVKRGISYQSMREAVYLEPVAGRNTQEKEVTVKVIRVAVGQLIKAGLIESVGEERRLIFRCILADQDKSVKNRKGRGRAEEKGRGDGIAEPSLQATSEGMRGRGNGIPETPRKGTPLLSILNTERDDKNAGAVHQTETDPPIPQPTRCGQLAGWMIREGVRITSHHPLLLDWVSQSLSDAEAQEALQRARIYKKPPEAIPASYLGKIVSTVISERKKGHITPYARSQKPKPEPLGKARSNHDPKTNQQPSPISVFRAKYGSLKTWGDDDSGSVLDPDEQDQPRDARKSPA